MSWEDSRDTETWRRGGNGRRALPPRSRSSPPRTSTTSSRHYIVTDHSQLITASAGVSYLWRSTRASVNLIAGSGLRRSVRHPNDSSNPAYQQLNVGLTQQLTLPAIGKMEARFDVINALGNDYVLRDGTGVGVFATQFGPPRGFFGGLQKVF